MVEKRILFVTVGTTAIRENLGKTPEDWGNLKRSLKNFERDAAGRTADELKQLATKDLFATVVAAHEATWTLNREEAFNRGKYTSAEMTSTVLLAEHAESGAGGKFHPERDRVVLLASDSAAGLFCAHVNAALLHRHLFEPACSCKSVIGDFKTTAGCPAVRIEVAKGMEARRELAKIFPAVKRICSEHAAGFDRILFNITGGYKGAIPAIAWLAENEFAGSRLFYQYEDVLDVMSIEYPGPRTEKREPKEQILRTASSSWSRR